jgi:peptidoglycan/LPS O-acetylase OafA/YrhL
MKRPLLRSSLSSMDERSNSGEFLSSSSSTSASSPRGDVILANENVNSEEEEESSSKIMIPSSYSEPYAWSTSLDSKPPLLISSQCTRALVNLFRNTYYSTIPNFPIPNHNHTDNVSSSSDIDEVIMEEEEESNYLLSLLVESSSHPVGLSALEAQPWLYAGPGLGNMDACPLQMCIAGGNNRRDSVVFAAVCIVPECSAYDLAAADFIPTAQRQLQYIQQQYHQYNTTTAAASNTRNTWELAREYIALLQHIAEINKFLGTGWTCGDFVVPWTPWPFGIPYLLACMLVLVLCMIPKHNHKLSKTNSQQKQKEQRTSPSSVSSSTSSVDPCCSLFVCQPSSSSSSLELNDKDQRKSGRAEEEEEATMSTTLCTPSNAGSISVFTWQGKGQNDWKNATCHERDNDQQIVPFLPNGDSTSQKIHTSTFHYETTATLGQRPNLFWSAFDLTDHWHRLVRLPPRDTACLDGMRVGSIFWIMLGHCMAIQSSTGAGYSNPASFLPPAGLTTTWLGQLLFSSRLAVDTFLVLSGFLVAQGLYQKLPLDLRSTSSPLSGWSLCRHVLWRYCYHLPLLLLNRIARILPLYAFCLGFYTQVAPHLDFGKYPSPFWFQWIGLLKPCQDNIWTNVLFVNNFIPFDTPTTNTCFYHSWYLAVDMQLFLLAPLLVFLYQVDPRRGKYWTLALFFISVAVTAYLSWVRRWSVNTFDGAAVARYDMEAYAKPHVRAQAYLAGMYVAMLLIDDKTIRQSTSQQQQQHYRAKRSPYLRKHRIMMGLCLMVMVVVTFITATGAYSRRPCMYREDPWKDPCGSSWPPEATFVYTAFSRTAWCISIAGLVHLCIGRGGICRHELVAGRDEVTRDRSNSSMVSSILSWHCWAPLSHLSFGAYLIHPIVIFIWQLGDREKQVFRLFTFGMDYLSVCVVSFVAALLAALFVEFPLATLWRNYTLTNKSSLSASGKSELVFPEDMDSVIKTPQAVDNDEGVSSSIKLLAFSSSSESSESNYGSIIHNG